MKPDKVVFANDELEEAYDALPENDKLKRGIKRAITFIQEDAFCGRNVKRELIPHVLRERFGIKSLRIYNLPDGWRLLYSVGNQDVQIVAVVLMWMNHKEYERLFGF